MKKYDRFLTRDYLMAALHRALRDKQLAAKLIGWIGASEDELEMVDAGFLAVKFRDLGLDDADDGDPHFAFGGRRKRPRRRRGTGNRRDLWRMLNKQCESAETSFLFRGGGWV